MSEEKKANHQEAKKFAEQILRYPAPLDRAKVETLAQAYLELANESLPSADKGAKRTIGELLDKGRL